MTPDAIKDTEVIISTQAMLKPEGMTLIHIEPGSLLKETLGYTQYGTGDYMLWSDDGRYLYYQIHYSSGNFSVGEDSPVWFSGWAAYDVNTHIASIISPPIKYYPCLWQTLGIDPPDDAELRGLISPSGRYVLYSIYYQGTNAYPYGTSEIWFASLQGENKKKLLDLPFGTEPWGVELLPDESKVFFNIPLEMGAALYIFDINKTKLLRLEDISAFNDLLWDRALSPDGTVLAAVGTDSLYLIDLTDGSMERIGELASNLQWSKDSNSIYYWKAGPSQDDCSYPEVAKDLRVYDRDKGRAMTLVDASVFEKEQNIVRYSIFCERFLVSPDEKHIVIVNWERIIWLMVLNND